MSLYALDAVFRPRSVALVGASPRERSVGRAILRNYEGVITTYTWPVQLRDVPQATKEAGDQEQYKAKDGVATLLAGDRLCLEPAGLSRKQRVSH